MRGAGLLGPGRSRARFGPLSSPCSPLLLTSESAPRAQCTRLPVGRAAPPSLGNVKMKWVVDQGWHPAELGLRECLLYFLFFFSYFFLLVGG